jgi:hypothetical protein
MDDPPGRLSASRSDGRRRLKPAPVYFCSVKVSIPTGGVVPFITK